MTWYRLQPPFNETEMFNRLKVRFLAEYRRANFGARGAALLAQDEGLNTVYYATGRAVELLGSALPDSSVRECPRPSEGGVGDPSLNGLLTVEAGDDSVLDEV